MAKALITGIAGSGGSYLADYILQHQPKVEVHGISRWHTSNQSFPANLRHCADKIHLHECDLLDFSSVFRVMREVKPDYVFHLAAHANVRASFVTPLAV